MTTKDYTNSETGSHQMVSTVSQRTVVLLEEDSSLAVATVPKRDLGALTSNLDGTPLLINLASELYGVSRSRIITSAEYQTSIELIQNEGIWEAFSADYRDLYGEDGEAGYEEFSNRIRTFRAALGRFEESWDPQRSDWDQQALLARHGFLSQLAPLPDTNIAQATLFPGKVPLSFLLENINAERALDVLGDHDISPEAFLLSLDIHNSALVPNYKIRGIVEDIYGYQVPFGNSPDLRVRSIVDLLKEGANTVAIGLKSASEGHSGKVLGSGSQPNILIDLGNDVAGTGSRDMPLRFEAAIMRGRAGPEETRQQTG